MALVLTNDIPQIGTDVWGRNRVAVQTITFDDSYPTGGESLTPAMVGLSQFSIVLVSVAAGTGSSGHVVQFNYATNKLMVFIEEAVAAGGALVEVGDEEDLEALVVRVLAVGI